VVLQGFNSNLTMLDGRGEGGGDSVGFSGPPSSSSRSEGRRPSSNAPAFQSAGMDDDIPF
jgi:single-strand DNA-binding protein